MTGSDEPVHTTEVDEDEPSDALDRAAPATSVPWDLTQLRSDDIPAMAAVPQPEPAAPEYRATVHELSERLRELQRPIRILSALQWPVEVQERFFAAGAQQQPEVTRDTCPALRYDVRELQRALDELTSAIRNRLGRVSPVGS